MSFHGQKSTLVDVISVKIFLPDVVECYNDG